MIPEKGKVPHISLLPIPTPEDNMMVVRVEATAINPLDELIARTGTLVEQYPVVLGGDVAGVVMELGKDVESRGVWKVGDRVFTLTKPGAPGYGTFADFCVVDEDLVGRIPLSMSFDEAAAIPSGLLIAGVALFHSLGLSLPKSDQDPRSVQQPTKSILIWGASSIQGMYAVQLALWLGLEVIAACAKEDLEKIKDLGARFTIDEDNPESMQKIQDILSTEKELSPLHYALNTSSSTVSSDACASLLSTPGNARLAYATQPPSSVPESIVVRKVLIDTLYQDPQLRAISSNLLHRIPDLLRKGCMKPCRSTVLPNGLNSIPYGIRELEAGKAGGIRMVLHPRDTK